MRSRKRHTRFMSMRSWQQVRAHPWFDGRDYGWRKKYGELEPTDVKRLRELEAENAKLKRMVAEREMAIDTLKEINRKKW